MKIFVTGGSGFVGRALIPALKDNHEVVAMARSVESAEKIAGFGGLPVRTSLATVSAEDLAGCEVVIHAAAHVAPWGERETFWKVNVEGTERLLKVAREAGVRRFVFIGTEAALFTGKDLIGVDESYPYPEQHKFLYSETKAEAEKRVLQANEPEVFETISVRPRFVWGPGDTTILPNLMKMVDEGRFRWISKGQLNTSTTFIGNLVYGIRLAMEKGKGGEAYFITDDENLTFRDFLSQLLGATGRNPGKKSVPGWFVRFAAWGMETLWSLLGKKTQPALTRFSASLMASECTINIEKARRELGYRPRVTIEAGMKAVAQDFNQ